MQRGGGEADVTIAIFGNLDIGELLLIAAAAVIIFGRNLPRVAAQAIVNLQRARRHLQSIWRDSGIGAEMRDLQRKIERDVPRLDNPLDQARKVTDDFRRKARELKPDKLLDPRKLVDEEASKQAAAAKAGAEVAPEPGVPAPEEPAPAAKEPAEERFPFTEGEWPLPRPVEDAPAGDAASSEAGGAADEPPSEVTSTRPGARERDEDEREPR